MSGISINKPVRIGEVTIIAIDRCTTFSNQTEKHAWWYLSKEPVAVVACDRHGVHAFLVPQGEIAWEQLQQITPGIADIVRGCSD